MNSDWTRSEVESILSELEQMGEPANKYQYVREDGQMQLLGSGGSGYVYEAVKRGKERKRYAIKITGFGKRQVDSESFRHIVAQQQYLTNTVPIRDSYVLRVWQDADGHVTRAERAPIDWMGEEEENKRRQSVDYLELQYLVMDRLMPVYNKHRENPLYPDALAGINKRTGVPSYLHIRARKAVTGPADEQEIIHLAYDIGTALRESHAKDLLHLDVKLENIFYDERHHKYLLGDYDIAERTEDGMVAMKGGTNGYCAPEVYRHLGIKCDNTADIYSLGITLYLLLNRMRFPDGLGEGNRPNMSLQYMEGYVLPEPIGGSDELVQIVLKMCSYRPEDRYQSMSEVLTALHALHAGADVRYVQNHRPRYLVLGLACGIMGVIIGMMTWGWRLELQGGRWLWLFLACCALYGIQYYVFGKHDACLLPCLLVGLGIYLVVTNGVAWWKVLLLILIFADEGASGVVGIGGALLLLGQRILYDGNLATWLEIGDARWVSIALLSLCALLILQYELGQVYDERDKAYRRTRFWYFTAYWAYVGVMYGMMIMTNAMMLNTAPINMWRLVLGQERLIFLHDLGLGRIGWMGLAFSIFMLITQILGVRRQSEWEQYGYMSEEEYKASDVDDLIERNREVLRKEDPEGY